MSTNVFADDPSWAVSEFLVLALDALAHRISTNPTILSSRIQNQEAADALDGVIHYGAQIDPPEMGDPRLISYLAEEMRADPDEQFVSDLRGYVPEIDRIEDEEAREFLEEVDEGYDYSGWYARLGMPGYLDATEWIGPYGSEDEAYEALVEERGPLQPSETVRAVLDFLDDAWRIYRAPIAEFETPPEADRELRRVMRYFLVNTLGFDADFARELLRELPRSYHHYLRETDRRRER